MDEKVMEKAIARTIGYFYYDKNLKNEDAAIREINSLGILRIDYDNRVVVLTLSRPGLFIGKKGQNIMALTKWLKEEFGESVIKEFKIKEDPIIDHLFDFDIRHIADDVC